MFCMTNTNLVKVYEAVRDSKEPITSEEIGEKTGLTRSSVQYACTILVAAEKIERYHGIRGVFILHKPSPGVATPSKNDLRKEASRP